MVRASIIARRYAEAYFALAQAAGDVVGWREQLAGVVEILGDAAVSEAPDAVPRPDTTGDR